MQFREDDAGDVRSPVDLRGQPAGVDVGGNGEVNAAVRHRHGQPGGCGDCAQVVERTGVVGTQHQGVATCAEQLGSAQVHQAPLIDDDQRVADLLQLTQQVRGDDDGATALGDAA